MINFKIFFGYNTKQREKTILTNFVSDHFSYPSVINPNKMSYLWSIHKRLRGSWIGHIEGPWSWSCSMTSFWTNFWIDFFDDTFDRNVCWKFYEKFIGNLRSMQGRIPSRLAQQSPSCCAATDLHLFSICLQQQQLAFFYFEYFSGSWLFQMFAALHIFFCAYLLLAPSSQAWSPNPRHDMQVENHSGPLLALDHWRGKLKAIMEV